MALYIPHSIFHLARLLDVRPETFGPYYIFTHNVISKLNILYSHISSFVSKCAVPNVAVLCTSLMSCFAGMLLRHF